MAKVAGKSYPADLGPEEAEKWMEILVNEFGGKAESKEAFAQAVGHKSTKSGTFNRKIADARKYGLMTPRGSYEATDLGLRLANPESKQQRHETVRQMLQNVSVLEEIHSKLNGSPPPDEFWRVITELTEANPKEARDAIDWLEGLYGSLVEAELALEGGGDEMPESDENEGKPTAKASAHNKSEDAQTGEHSASDSAIYLRVDGDELRFEELTDTYIQLAQQFLETKKKDSEEGTVQMRFG